MAAPIDVSDPTELARLSLFKDVRPQALVNHLIRCEQRCIAAGEILLTPARENHHIYVLLAGRLSVHLDAVDSPPLARVEAGDCVGEMSILGQQSPSAFVVAAETSRLLAIPRDTLWALIDESPRVARNLLYVLAQRVRYGHTAILARERSANIDPLTGLHNRRWLEAAFERLRPRLQDRPLSLIMADVDYFKRFNDRYGHLAGDRVLCAVGEAIGRHVRPSDLIARFGGEEFVMLLPDADLTEALGIAERVRQGVAGAPGPQGLPPVTISLGVAELHADEPLQALVARADAALYRAKSAGRNRVSE